MYLVNQRVGETGYLFFFLRKKDYYLQMYTHNITLNVLVDNMTLVNDISLSSYFYSFISFSFLC